MSVLTPMAVERLSLGRAQSFLVLPVIGIAGFHISYAFSARGLVFAFLPMVLFLYTLIRLSIAVPTARSAFYTGLGIGFGIYAPQLGFFWSLFGPPAVSLWTVLAFWVAFFALLVHACHRQFGPFLTAVAIPLLWTGLEYFRSELYYLRFAWLSPGLSFSNVPGLALLGKVGVYGIGFLLMAMASGLSLLRARTAVVTATVAALVVGFMDHLQSRSESAHEAPPSLTVAGVQVEFPVELEVPAMLDRALQTNPKAQLFMLSEYAFDGPIPKCVREWCKRNQRYLLAGGKDLLSSSQFYDTAFVVSPTGEIVFQQAKSVPIQFFKDGLPAKERRPWNSPWGKLGICICYDLSYSRVTDDLVRQGIVALLVPTMDVESWGRHEHELHARVAPMRGAEYGIPIFRVASSGVSQIVDGTGRVRSSAPFSDKVEILSGDLDVSHAGQLPMDRGLAPVCIGITAIVGLWLVVNAALVKRKRAGERLRSDLGR